MESWSRSLNMKKIAVAKSGSKTQLLKLKEDYLWYLDHRARHLAGTFKRRSKVTPLLLKYIAELYRAAHLELKNGEDFKAAYHAPVTADLEFLIARFLLHYSHLKKRQWKIYLRSGKKTVPDIRIEKDGATLAIIELKAKAGWMQYFLSEDRFKEDLRRFKEKKSKFDPREGVKQMRQQLRKYSSAYGLSPEGVFMLLPTLALVDRVKYGRKFKDYKKTFVKHSRLPADNLIILSKNPRLDLSNPRVLGKTAQSTRELERFMKKITRL